MSQEFIQFLRTRAEADGASKIHLSSVYGRRGDRYFFIEPMFVFDVWEWKIVGWTNHQSIGAMRSMSALPQYGKWILAARGWESLVEPNCTFVSLHHVVVPMMFPLCNGDRAVADDPKTWAFLTDRACWINRDGERCACIKCYPEHLRDEDDFSRVQLEKAHCVHCACNSCRCKLSLADSCAEMSDNKQCDRCVICLTRKS